MGTQKEDLAAAVESIGQKIAGIGDLLVDYSTDIQAAIAKLQADISAGLDVTESITALTTLAGKVDEAATSIKALDVTAEGISGQPTPPPPPVA